MSTDLWLPTNADLAWFAQHDPARLEEIEYLLRAELDETPEVVVSPYAWRSRARPPQIPPADPWRVWYVRGGRGGGKTWTGSHAFAEMLQTSPAGEWAVVAPTYGDARDVCIESQKSGLIKALGGRAGPNGILIEKGPHIVSWNRSMGDLRLANGSVIYADGADDGALRIQGKSLSGAWCDEIGLWRQWATAWDESIRYAVREAPGRIIATGTPKRNMKAAALVRRLLEDDAVPKSQLRTEDNADNLDPAALEEMLAHRGTALGRQELEGELLDEVEGALWTLAMIDRSRRVIAESFYLEARVVAVDPALTNTAESAETGIVVVGRGTDGDGWVLDDRTLRGGPTEWATEVWRVAVEHECEGVVVEDNAGMDLLVETLVATWRNLVATGDFGGFARRVLQPRIHRVHALAGHSKRVRAVPIVGYYEAGRIHHVSGGPDLSKLEAQLTGWDGTGDSPDRLDALVWGLTWLLLPSQSRDRSRTVVRQERWGAVAGGR